MTISPYKKVALYKISTGVTLAVLDTLLTPSRLFCSLAFATTTLTKEESDFVERSIKECLGEYSQYVCIVLEDDKISVSLLESQVKNLGKLPNLNT